MIKFYVNYRTMLRDQLQIKVDRNHRYSLRSFAKDLDLTSGHLSEILNGKSGISIRKAKTLTRFLKLLPLESEYFLLMVQSEHARSSKAKQEAFVKLDKLKDKYREHFLTYENFRLVSDWMNFAILEVVTSIHGNWTLDRLSKFFDKPKRVIEECVQRLQYLQLIKITGNQITASNERNAVAARPDKDAIRNYHSELITIAKSQLNAKKREKNEYSTTLVAIDPEKLNEARQLVKNFWRDFCELMETGKKKSELYCLSVQLFHLTGEQHVK